MNKENHFDSIIYQNWKTPIYDGITNISKFRKSKIKILWILKEAHKANNTPWNHRDFHKDVSGYKYWRKTYQKIMYVCHGIIYGKNCLEDISDIENNGTIDGENILESIAIINVNKSGIKSPFSFQHSINRAYHNKKEIILKQIEEINPDIIINSSRVWDLFTDLSSNKIEKAGKFNFSRNKKRLIINCYHPNAFYSERKYCDTILKLINNGKYWARL
jgi:hypothetical protein